MVGVVGREEKDKQVDADPNGAAGASRATAPKTLDRWFDAELNRLYVDVVNEPLPDDLARLVAQLKAQKQK